MIDLQGYRLNVGIVLINPEQEIFWARRLDREIWQLPQGGIQKNETPREAMYRELWEEVGLYPKDVALLAESKEWKTYDLPQPYYRLENQQRCIGQKQKWFLVQLCSSEASICLTQSATPEFDYWCWVNYWYPEKSIILFKKAVYHAVLHEFYSIVFQKNLN